MSTPKVYRTDNEIVDLTQGAEPTEPERSAEFQKGADEARAKLGDTSAAERVSRERMARAGTQRSAIKGPGPGPLRKGSN